MTTVLTAEHLSPISPEELRTALGLEEGSLHRGLAALIRIAVRRWRPATRRDVRAFMVEQLDACGWSELDVRALVDGAVDALVALREMDELRVRGRPVLVPAVPRLVEVSKNCGLLAGCHVDPPGVTSSALPGAEGAATIARWIRRERAVEDSAAEAGYSTWSLEQWVGMGGCESTSADSRCPSGERWLELEAAFGSRAGPVSDPAACAVLVGPPGGFYGKAAERSGRWKGGSQLPDGLWCGALPGFQPDHQHPCLVRVIDGVPTRAAPLHDWSEFDHAVLCRGIATGAPELVYTESHRLVRTGYLPRRILEVLDVLGAADGWSYRTHSSVVEALGDYISSTCGVRVIPRVQP